MKGFLTLSASLIALALGAAPARAQYPYSPYTPPYSPRPYAVPSDDRVAYYASDSYFQRSGGTPEQWIANMCHDLIGRWPAPVEVRNWMRDYYNAGGDRQRVAALFLVGADNELAGRSAAPYDPYAAPAYPAPSYPTRGYFPPSYPRFPR